MTFLAPWFLLGLVALAVPLILHLRRSRRAQKIIFSTTQFFDEQFIRSARRARIQDLLLLALRLALLVFFVMALAQPLLRTPGLAGMLGFGTGRQVVIVLDDSASMTATGAHGVLFDRSRDAALAVVEDLSPAAGDKATVVLAGLREAGPTVLFQEPTADVDALRQAIRDVRTTDLGTDLPGAIRAGARAMGLAGDGSGAGAGGEIYVFSDLQESAMPVGRIIDPDTRAGLLMVAARPPEAAANLSVDAVQYGAARPMLRVPFTFRALVTNHGPRSRVATVTLRIDEETLGQKEVEVPAGRSRVVRFTHRFTAAGWHSGRVGVAGGQGAEAETLEADNHRHFTLQVEDRLRILAVNGAPSHVAAQDELFFFRHALTARPQAAARTGVDVATPPVTVDQVQPVEVTPRRIRDYRLVVLANVRNLSPEALKAVEQYVDQGGSLLVTLGDRVDAEAYNTWLGEHRLHGGILPGRLAGLVETAEDDLLPAEGEREAHFIASLDQAHPVLAGFAPGDLGSLASVRFTSHYRIEPNDADVLMRTAAGNPLLLERRLGRGRVMLFAATIDRDWTNFPLQPTYLPWLYRTVSYLAQQKVERANFVQTGQIVRLPASATRLQPLEITRPDGEPAYGGPDPRRPDAAGADVFADTADAGVYRIGPATGKADAEPIALFAANLPPAESRPRAADRPTVEALGGEDVPVVYIDDPDSVTAAGAEARHGYGLWNLLLGICLVVALAEPWVANRLSKRRAAQADDALSRRDVLPGSARPAA